MLPTDRWLLSRLARTIAYATAELENGEYSTARTEIKRFFWSDLCDNYLELAKTRLYRAASPERDAAQWTLYHHALLSVLKMLAPYMPYIAEEIYQSLFGKWEAATSIHTSPWPKEHPERIDAEAEEMGKTLLELLRQVRRHKAERGLSVGADLDALYIRLQPAQRPALEAALVDLRSATRAQSVVLEDQRSESIQSVLSSEALLLEI